MYYTGVNIGGLFSQNKNFSDEYLDNFITENDIKRISNWGFNLIRLPFYDYHKEKVDYPGKLNNYSESITQIVEKNNRYFANFLKDIDKFWDKNEILKLLKPVLEFRNKHNVPVLCGEFGCIIRADKAVRGKWLKDVVDIFKENKISYTYWTYKNMDFGIYDFTKEYKNNENYDVEDRLDSNTLETLQSGIKV